MQQERGLPMTTDVQGMARELALGLLMQQWQPRHLSPSHTDSAERLVEHCLEEAIALREAGQSGLSLELLQAAERMGVQTPWLLDNQARALVNLDERQAAWGLWQRLIHHSEAEVAETAQAMVALQEQTLLNALQSICSRDGWQPRHLSAATEAALLESVLHEIIAAREADYPQLSLDLVAETLAQGWRNPWLLDNQARALVNLNRSAEAVSIWQGLRGHADAALASAAAEMLDLYQGPVEYQQLQERCSQLVLEGDPGQAQRLLVDALLQNPDAEPLRQLLAQVLQPSGEGPEDQILRRQQAQLTIHERILDELEQRLREPQERPSSLSREPAGA
jgi:hypothetical protein